ncbi:hypothetical protein DQ04_11511010 [Trypanosoma grayi]|uniref:hypothetical protein n=1 Tax=Trypanosoma grayi TaxID=71804 RepID=UPI0004F4067E|nr:hypothetical protein DQ04_11511010 [Trypanosoma grayi]KEG06952.1 hypothetical protein DQ04_11511010 [Trypanosoma grayi]
MSVRRRVLCVLTVALCCYCGCVAAAAAPKDAIAEGGDGGRGKELLDRAEAAYERTAESAKAAFQAAQEAITVIVSAELERVRAFHAVKEAADEKNALEAALYPRNGPASTDATEQAKLRRAEERVKELTRHATAAGDTAQRAMHAGKVSLDAVRRTHSHAENNRIRVEVLKHQLKTGAGSTTSGAKEMKESAEYAEWAQGSAAEALQEAERLLSEAKQGLPAEIRDALAEESAVRVAERSGLQERPQCPAKGRSCGAADGAAAELPAEKAVMPEEAEAVKLLTEAKDHASTAEKNMNVAQQHAGGSESATAEASSGDAADAVQLSTTSTAGEAGAAKQGADATGLSGDLSGVNGVTPDAVKVTGPDGSGSPAWVRGPLLLLWLGVVASLAVC